MLLLIWILWIWNSILLEYQFKCNIFAYIYIIILFSHKIKIKSSNKDNAQLLMIVIMMNVVQIGDIAGLDPNSVIIVK
jgi:hypothetical protein